MAREDLHFRLRIPEDLKKKIEAAAVANGQSMTAEMVGRLYQSFETPVSLPQDLLTRISTYADRQGRSANEEILRLLEREYPEQWTVDDRMEYLANLLSVLKAGTADPRIDQFIRDVQETVEGVVSGRVKGVTDRARRELADLWDNYQERLAESHQDSLYDDEEDEMSAKFGHTEKLAEPLPNPRKDSYLLMDFLPPDVLFQITNKLRKSDTKGAADILANLDANELSRWVEEDRLPMLERWRRIEELETPPAPGKDPFKD